MPRYRPLAWHKPTSAWCAIAGPQSTEGEAWEIIIRGLGISGLPTDLLHYRIEVLS